MKKILLSLIVLFCAAFTCYAQVPGEGDSGFRISGGFGIGAGIGSHASDYPVASGLNVNFEIPTGDELPLNIILKTGYTFFISKDGYSYSSYYGTTGSLVSFVPLQAGARIYMNKLFIEAAAGASFCINNTYQTYTARKTALLVSPAIGYGFRFGYSGKMGLDLSLGYDARLEKKSEIFYDDGTVTSYGSFNQVAFRIAFSYGL